MRIKCMFEYEKKIGRILINESKYKRITELPNQETECECISLEYRNANCRVGIQIENNRVRISLLQREVNWKIKKDKNYFRRESRTK